MSNRFVCASANTGAPFYSIVTPKYILSAVVGPYLPSNTLVLTEYSHRFLHMENLLGDPLTSKKLA